LKLSETGVEINLEKFSSGTQVRKTHEHPLDVYRLGLSPDADKTCSDASLGLLLVGPSR
jgi:hypothetical protein